MIDPWHGETLEALIAYLQAPERGTIAIVATSGRELSDEVENGLRDHLGEEREIVDLLLAAEAAAQSQLPAIVRREVVPGRVILVKGLPAMVRHQSHAEPEEVPAVLRYLNLNRELFDRPGEAFVFLVDAETATAVAASAPDFNRYTSWFELISWDDVVSSAGQTVDRAAAERQSWQGREREAAELVGRLREQSAGPDRMVEPLLRHAESLRSLGKLRQALEVAQEAVAAAGVPPEGDKWGVTGRVALEADALTTTVGIELRLGNADRAIELARQAQAAAGRGDSLELKAHAHTVLALALDSIGRSSEAVDEHEKAIDFYKTLSHYGSTAVGNTNVAVVLARLGNLSEASNRAEAALSESRAGQSIFAECLAGMALARAQLSAGHLDRAARNLGQAQVLASTSVFEEGRLYVLGLLGALETAVGRPARARSLLTEVLAAARRAEAFNVEAGAAFGLADALLAVEGPAGPRELMEGILAQARSRRLRPRAASAGLGLGLAMEADGDSNAAVERIEAARQEFQQMGYALQEAEAKRHLARIFRLTGEAGRAAELGESALAIDRKAGARPAEVRDLTELAFLAVQNGGFDGGRQHAEEALAILRETGTRLDQPAALAALAAAYEGAGRAQLAESVHRRWRRLVTGMEAAGLGRWIERSLAAGPW